MQYPLAVPALKHDAMMRKQFPKYDRPLNYRQRVERFIFFALCTHLDECGFKVVKVDDGEEVLNVDTIEEAMEYAFGVDECKVVFRAKDNTGGRFPVQFIWDNGEDGMTCISDWGYAANDVGGFNAAMEAFDEEAAVFNQRNAAPL